MEANIIGFFSIILIAVIFVWIGILHYKERKWRKEYEDYKEFMRKHPNAKMRIIINKKQFSGEDHPR